MALYSAAGNDTPEVVVDLANVCRCDFLDSSPDKARWDRFEVLMALWNEWAPDFAQPVTLAIADNSLRHDFGTEDRKRFEQAEKNGLVRAVPEADRPILEIAEKVGCAVLSRDNFRAFRSEFPWIDDNFQQFVFWYVEDGRVLIDVKDMGQVESFDRSRAEEESLLKERRIRLEQGLGADLLNFMYRCDDPGCMQHQFDPSYLRTIPKRGKDDEPVCPGCGHRLSVVGSRPRSAIIKVFAPEGEPARVTVAAGQSLPIGRRHGRQIDVKKLLDSSAATRVSRDHAEVRFDGSKVFVRDLGSTNGSEIEPWHREAGRREPGQRLEPDRETELRPRDRLVVAGVLVVERSGRRLPYDLPLPKSHSTSSRSDDPVTNAVSDELPPHR